MSEFIWLEGEDVAFLPRVDVPDPLIPRDARNILVIGVSGQTTSSAERVASADDLDGYREDSFDLVMAADFVEVPPIHRDVVTSPGSAVEVIRKAASLVRPGGLLLLHLWPAAVYSIHHHSVVAGSPTDVVRKPKVWGELAVSILQGTLHRLESRTEFAKLLPEGTELLTWYPTFLGVDSLVPHLEPVIHGVMRLLPGAVSSSAFLVARKRPSRVDATGGLS